MTAVHLPGVKDASIADWGDHDPTEMIRRLRQKAAQDRITADAIYNAHDHDFIVETYRGPIAQTGRRRIWPPEETP